MTPLEEQIRARAPELKENPVEECDELTQRDARREPRPPTPSRIAFRKKTEQPPE
jgi:hypothetical protein